MSQSLVKTIADFNTVLSSAVAIGDTTATLTSATDDDGVALPTGTYAFTIDRNNSSKEYIQCTLTGTALTNIKTLARGTGVATSGFARAHRKGAEVIISDFVAIKRITDLLDGTTNFDSGTPLGYDGAVTPTTANQFAPKSYVDAAALGTVTVTTVILPGNAGETVSSGNLLYLNVADGEWYKCDADTAASVDNIILAIAQGAGTDGVAISGGVMLQGLDTHQTGLTNNTAYYASNTAGGISSTPGTTEVSVGVSRSTTSLLFYPRYNQQLTEDQQDALAGSSGTPSSSNKYVTNDDTDTAATSGKVVRRNGTQVTVPSTPSASTDATSKNYVDSLFLSGVTQKTYPLGESFTGATTPQAAVILNDLHQYFINFVNDVTTSFGKTTTYTQQAIKIIPRSNVTANIVRFQLLKNGAPADNITVEIQGDSSGSPDNTAITNGTSGAVAGSGLSTTTPQLTSFSFSTPFSLTAGTTYWIVLKRSGATSDTDFYFVSGNDSASNLGTATYNSFAGKYRAAGVWSSQATFIPYVEVIPSSGSGSYSLWLSVNNGAYPLQNCDGVVTTTGSAGTSGTLNRGNVSGFSSLISQEDYFVSSTPGTLTNDRTTGGSYVGTASSSTQLAIPLSRVQQQIVEISNHPSGFDIIHFAESDGFFLATIENNNQDKGTLNISDNGTSFTVIGSVETEVTGGLYDSSNIPVKKGQYYKYINIGTYSNVKTYWRANR